ncbi:HDOD domain-containing protein [Nitrosomonas sp. JL21]|uniref:EAL and HDOD domain-containing protein n=1 Tax=Nitrosomonas sp. JL21 TaxID=153949 RepID=UPI00136C0C43|nr:HDOD domain-containing protein [Nitrosomonas sp. JL21]MBL8498251.1 HDOD domain-containing protein [Nitrosomonas sp.]MCC7092377.1 HDOD domain-containing protein [Nitrosomonas sp.]MXS77717.1 HDOD domain-containing protein [Nitrosomonas sp. JL21]
MDSYYLGRQPIVDRNQNLVAYELLFRQEVSEDAVKITDDLSASAIVIANAYGRFGIQNVVGQQRGFINADLDLIRSDIISLLPSKHVVLEVRAPESISAEFLQQCHELKQRGYQFALDSVAAIDANIEQLLSIVSIVKVDVLSLNTQSLEELVTALKRWPVLLLALKVENREQEIHCKQLGFQMFQGYHFAKPEVMAIKRADPGKLSLLRLLELITDTGDSDEIEREFKRQPALSYNLLRMVNSVTSDLPRKINSIRHAITLMGREQLLKWIQLLLYTSDQSEEATDHSLIPTALERGKLMELIAAVERPHDKNHQERAFIVGILSLLDELLGIEMRQIVNKLGISDDMHHALISREGRLGVALKLIEANEQNETSVLEPILNELGFLSPVELIELKVQAADWAMETSHTVN